MSKRNRIFLGILLIYVLGVAYVLFRVMVDLDPRYKESAEELMVDTAHLLASLIETDIRDGAFRPGRLRPAFDNLYARSFEARIYDVTKLHVGPAGLRDRPQWRRGVRLAGARRRPRLPRTGATSTSR